MGAVTPPVVIALDVGGTTLRAGLVTAEGRLLHSVTRSSVRNGRRDPGLAGTVTAAREMIAAAAERGVTVAGIGAGFPEYVDAAGRLTSHEVLDWAVQPLELLGPLVPGRPAVVESDVRCAALAEARSGGGQGRGSFLYVSLGTGLSAVLIQGGRLWHGNRGEAIALGSFEVPASVDPGFSAGGNGGRPPNLEEYAAGAGIAARYTKVTGVEVTEARDVVRRAEAGDGTATELLSAAGRALGTSLAWTVALLDPEAVVLGGGLGTSSPRMDGVLHDALRKSYTARCARPGPPPVHPAGLGAASGLLGAAAAAWHESLEPQAVDRT
ncbi:MAG: ROK family protein [Streptomyces sp.]|uniref:ROK family protein n=1 Tax=Streptomyces sp. TaxID=1931 RepID=UPI003D6C5954